LNAHQFVNEVKLSNTVNDRAVGGSLSTGMGELAACIHLVLVVRRAMKKAAPVVSVAPASAAVPSSSGLKSFTTDCYSLAGGRF
jgi:hypothetical protein